VIIRAATIIAREDDDFSAGTPNVSGTTRETPEEAFRKGYLDAWSIRDNATAPLVPAYSVEPGEDPYRAGVARAVRDAAMKAFDSARQR
jgi:hypothetical protein